MDRERGRHLLSAVERIVRGPGALAAEVRSSVVRAGADPCRLGDEGRAEAASDLIRRFSNRTALSGGLSALPGLFPGGGTVVAALGGAMADLTLTLKYEVELVLSLMHLHEHDITDEVERKRAYLLASVATWEVEEGRSLAADLVDVEATAAWRYAPRQLTKVLVDVMTNLAVRRLPGSATKAVPVVGILVGTTLNKTLTTRVGRRCLAELERRRRLGCDAARDLALENRGPLAW